MRDWIIERCPSPSAGPGQQAGDDGWLLVARIADSDRVLASMQVGFEAGDREPRYWFHHGRLIHTAPEIGVTRHHATLSLCSDLAGATEFLAMQGAGEAAALLVRAACLWLARDRPRAQRVFAELRPCASEAAAQTPFFDGVMAHFLHGEGLAAGARAGRLDVSGLLPRHPIHVAMLPDGVQQAIGRADAGMDAWQSALSAQGLRPGRLVTVFDAAPVYEGSLEASVSFTSAAQRQLAGLLPGAGPVGQGHVLAITANADVARIVEGRCVDTLLEVAAEQLAHEDLGTAAWCTPV